MNGSKILDVILEAEKYASVHVVVMWTLTVKKKMQLKDAATDKHK